jgi:hypothetical protein
MHPCPCVRVRSVRPCPCVRVRASVSVRLCPCVRDHLTGPEGAVGHLCDGWAAWAGWVAFRWGGTDLGRTCAWTWNAPILSWCVRARKAGRAGTKSVDNAGNINIHVFIPYRINTLP